MGVGRFYLAAACVPCSRPLLHLAGECHPYSHVCYTKVESCVAFVECVCAWCEFGVVLSGVFEVCVSSAIAPPIIPLLVDWLQVPVTAGGPFVGDCPLAEKFTNTNTCKE